MSIELTKDQKEEVIREAITAWLKDMHKVCDNEIDWYAGLAKNICGAELKVELLEREVKSLKAIVVDLNEVVLTLLGDR